MNRLAIIALSVATAFSGMPAWAGPAFVASPVQSAVLPQASNGDAQIETVGCNNFTNCPRLYNNGNNGGLGNSRHFRNDRRDWSNNNRNWNSNRNWDNRRYYRGGYRDHNSTGAIIGGLAAGALIGGVIASQPRVRSTGDSHADYCYSRYRSYRASDNTYQPNSGPRRQCL